MLRRATVEHLVEELEAALLLETARYRAQRAEVARAFAAAPVRPARHAGGAYHDDPQRLRRYIESDCLRAGAPPPRDSGRMAALCAPHMDLWRAAEGYGQAYGALAHALQDGCRNVDTFVVLGTSHARMRQPFAVCDKAFATPLGPMEADGEAIAELRAGARFDVEEDVLNHKTEHSIEFQVVFLRHLLGSRAASIVPILCGLGEAQARALQPAEDPAAESFAAALAGVVSRRRGRALVIAGADLAHVGPRFGDARPLDDASVARWPSAITSRCSVPPAATRAPSSATSSRTSTRVACAASGRSTPCCARCRQAPLAVASDIRSASTPGRARW